ncbi:MULTISPECIES: GntR family transcriptional regulator [unclassified Sinorhizobium]|uniref:GntR family transcriptional regulator n=1 Tax=unclassified Sinorhizobium TaxID=2613772 RepID=UPI0024C3A2A6|nr:MULTISPECIES: GntR family transcriptional regulator [unclassified Sinorhizobium]MDK1378153.1 GntR family transcriptional regulator [Sinorhizobium sp. 6-70]MDK1479798.1 GntR family transcriptional regulator [Sinorhizobium sp. 6-117]
MAGKTANPPTVGNRRERKGALYLWEEIYVALEKDILSRRIAPGARLPTEEELAARFQVHRNTVRRALDALEDRFLIRVEHGHGSFVREKVISHPMGSRQTLPIILKGLNRIGREDVLDSSTIRPARDVGSALKLKQGQYVRRVNLLTFVDDNPVMVTSGFFPLPRFHGIEKAIKETGSVPEGLQRLGVEEMVRYETRISTRNASRPEAELLQQTRSQPILNVKNIVVDSANQPILFTQVRMSSKWIELIIRYSEL